MESNMKLQFEENEYYLCKDGSRHVYATTDESYIAELGAQKLSRVNCEAVKNGYDLMKLAEEYSRGKSSSDVFKAAHKRDFIAGAKAILELLGDKKFSEEDMGNLWDFCVYNKGTFKEGIQSLQQTEWDVEIITEPFLSVGDNFHDKYQTRPKLDENGCLILKKSKL